MSLRDFQQFARTQIQILTTSETDYEFDCADFALFIIVKYYEYKDVPLDITIGKQTISSGSDDYDDFDQYYEKVRKQVGASTLNSDALTHSIPRELSGDGDLLTSEGHTMVLYPSQPLDEGKEIAVAQSSGAYYGKGDDRNYNSGPPEVKQHSSKMLSWNTKRWNMLTGIQTDNSSTQKIETLKIDQISQSTVEPELKPSSK